MINPHTAFAIEPLPLRVATQLPGSEPAGSNNLTDRRILIVDDEESVRNIFAEWLSENYVCGTAASAEEALDYLALQPCALVISDIMMPGRNGVELLREVTA